MAQSAGKGSANKPGQQEKSGKSPGKRKGTITPDPAQTGRTGPSGLHNLTSQPGTTED